MTADHFAHARENLQLQAELDALLAQQRHLLGLKARLDEAVRREAERAALERQRQTAALLAGVEEALRLPATQAAILQKCLADLEAMPSRALV